MSRIDKILERARLEEEEKRALRHAKICFTAGETDAGALMIEAAKSFRRQIINAYESRRAA